MHDSIYLYVDFVCWQGKSNLIAAAKTVGEASQEVMQGIGETADDMDRMYQVRAVFTRI